MTDTQASIGTIHTTAMERDAIHVAVIQAVARDEMSPGQSVFLEGGEAVAHMGTDAVGIVDPFLRNRVQSGERCWIFLFPNTVTNLRHHWTHPRVPETEPPQAPAIARLAADLEVSYSRALDALRDYAENGEPTHFGHYISYGSDMPAVWADYARVTGKTVADPTAFPFSCSC